MELIYFMPCPDREEGVIFYPDFRRYWKQREFPYEKNKDE
jgi:hypothetical protein